MPPWHQAGLLDGKAIPGASAFHVYYGYKQENEDFINAIQTGTDPLCTVEDAAQSMELAEKLLTNVI